MAENESPVYSPTSPLEEDPPAPGPEATHGGGAADGDNQSFGDDSPGHGSFGSDGDQDIHDEGGDGGVPRRRRRQRNPPALAGLAIF